MDRQEVIERLEGWIVPPVMQEPLETAITLLKQEWIPVTGSNPPPQNEPLWLHSKEWIDEDFNPKGVREGFFYPDGCFTAKWFDYQDCYVTDDNSKPTHWSPLPSPPTGE